MMKQITSDTEYRDELKARGVLPEGFRTGFSKLFFIPEELDTNTEMPMNMSLILLDKPTDCFAGVFTRNKFPGAPVLLCRSRLESESFRGIIINNKIANVCISSGLEDAEAVLSSAASLIGCDESELMVASTGVIGWRLPVTEMAGAIASLVDGAVSDEECNAAGLAERIMTTDSFPKLRSRKVCGGTITAVAKGAGMIEPNMATMLCFIMTDLDLPRETLRGMLPSAVSSSFNRITVDSDQSTSDMVIAVSSKLKECSDHKAFEVALQEICLELAEDVVRNGEGTGHVMKVRVSGAESEEQAAEIGKALANSPLVKTAIAGNDPNVGRFVSSVGDYCGNNRIDLKPGRTEIRLAGEIVFAGGSFVLDSDKEKRLSAYLEDCGMDPVHKGYPEHEKSVEIDINMGIGKFHATILGSDLTHEYVRENADYRT
ncbi:MAG: bifunctional glutamate N-acetyltransferase/amino-acid acetyltransferase ArgJ [Spirochaetales bacterium]|nr:bifunctional glutamate N-acetyltransferase/amino-acid acetyltransferase ArgJ [Spirochaetales bacterium]